MCLNTRKCNQCFPLLCLYVAPVKPTVTPEVHLVTPLQRLTTISTNRKQSDPTDSTYMDSNKDKSISESDFELPQNIAMANKAKHH